MADTKIPEEPPAGPLPPTPNSPPPVSPAARDFAKYLNHLAWVLFLVALILELVLGQRFLGAVVFVVAICCAIGYYVFGGTMARGVKALMLGCIGLVSAFVLLGLALTGGSLLFTRLGSRPPASSSATPAPAVRNEELAKSVEESVAAQQSDSAPSMPAAATTAAGTNEPSYVSEEQLQQIIDSYNKKIEDERRRQERAAEAPRSFEYVYADGGQRIYHRRGCESFTSSLTRVRRDVAEAQGIHEHTSCATMEKEIKQIP